MAQADQRLAVFPTRMTLTNLQGRIKGVEKGKSLIKRKSDAIHIRHKELAEELAAKREELEENMESAYYLLTRAEFYGGDLRIAKHKAKKHPVSVQISVQTVAGISVPVYQLAEPSSSLYFVGPSGGLMAECRQRFLQCLGLLVEIAGMETAFRVLDETYRLTNRRVSALENVILPRLENTVRYVQSELDEQDREDFYRLKKVQTKGKE